jgi:hypothetical protein
MKTAAKAILLATSLTVAASTVVAAPAHAYSGMCYRAARNYRTDFNYEPPPVCWTTVWFASIDGQHWDRPLPPDQDQGTRPPPPAPPSDVPPPPPGEGDDAAPPQP